MSVVFLTTLVSMCIMMGLLLNVNEYHNIDNNHVYGQLDNTSHSDKALDIQNISSQNVKVGDIDIAYKAFGSGEPIILISGSGNVMDVWPSFLLQELSLNQQVIIFDNRGVGNTTSGTKPFSIMQFANDTAGFMDALRYKKQTFLDSQWALS